MNDDWIYDIEAYPNVFTIALEYAHAPFRLAFEISPWRNDSREIIALMDWIKLMRGRMVGFNNLGFDYPVIHMLYRTGVSDARTLYDKAMAIIESQGNDRWTHMVYPSDRVVDQLDLYKIHHFDNAARATGLKVLEFNMRSDNIEDLPFPVGTELTREQTQTLKHYNAHDVAETKKFYHHAREMIEFREELTQRYQRDFMNHNDTKIGKDYFVMQLESAGVDCYEYGPNGRQPRQTPRPVIHLRDAILPTIQFDHPEFNRVLNWLKNQSITETKGVFKDLIASVNGFDFVFGLGGIHGSVESRVIEAKNGYEIIDLDVASYYPNLAIANHLKPEHLGEKFCEIYRTLYEQRSQYPKGSAQNAMLKLALNGVYGDSNSRFSVFYDPLFTMSITLNGQLLLCMLAEKLMAHKDIQLIQINTDGLTIMAPKNSDGYIRFAVSAWEGMTNLTLERADYSRMFIRDVNNYIAEYTDGKVKRKGAYEYKLGWHQNASALVVPKVAEKVLIEGASIEQTVRNWPDKMDFMLRAKVPRSSHLAIESADGEARKIQNTTRYYVADTTDSLVKWMPPLAKKPDQWRRIGINTGWNVCVCNDIRHATAPIDYRYYINEIEKLTMGLA